MPETPVTVGQQLILLLENYGVDTVFGIPGVHTLELYRGLANSKIQHITPRHEQGAGFMADGYARATHKPGVCFVITGPGLTNVSTAMAQALADSIPMLVISTVNKLEDLGKGKGCLHELPFQQLLARCVSLKANQLQSPEQLPELIDKAFEYFYSECPGPVHLEIPIDLLIKPADVDALLKTGSFKRPESNDVQVQLASININEAKKIVILAGGGSVQAAPQIRRFAQTLDAPVITTSNARGIMAGHDLSVPASPSLTAVRELLSEADCVIALGTEFGRTDYDMYVDSNFPELSRLIRVDVDINKLTTEPQPELAINSDVAFFLMKVMTFLYPRRPQWGVENAEKTRKAAFDELEDDYQKHHSILKTITNVIKDSVIVGDSTQPIYAGNLFFEASKAGSWFNSATGFGTLGYALPAAIGAAIGFLKKGTKNQVIALAGDGGFQFSMSELGVLTDLQIPVLILVWNNKGYGEIENSMKRAGIEPVGVSPSPPNLRHIAAAYEIEYESVQSQKELSSSLRQFQTSPKTTLVELDASALMS